MVRVRAVCLFAFPCMAWADGQHVQRLVKVGALRDSGLVKDQIKDLELRSGLQCRQFIHVIKRAKEVRRGLWCVASCTRFISNEPESKVTREQITCTSHVHKIQI